MIIFVTPMRKLFLALLSGLLFALSWPSIGFFPLIFFAFIPLLILEKESKNGSQVFWYSFFAFFLFNIITTYWIYHATIIGAIFAFIINSALMALSFWLFYKIKIITIERLGYFSLIVLWISMEYLHLNWDLSWPWLTLGNVFATNPYIIQWYEFTGFLGGTLWVILVNLLLYRVYRFYTIFRLLSIVCIILFPILLSLCMYFSYDYKQDNAVEVVIVQPNVDPYLEKFDIAHDLQLNNFIELAESAVTKETELLVGPETALIEGIWENQNNNYDKIQSISKLKAFQAKYPKLNIVIGANSYKLFKSSDQKSNTSREIRNENIFYDAYNSAVFLNKSGVIDVYHKTKLVPGVEKMPFPKMLDPLAKIAVDLGGTSGTLASDNYLNLFKFSRVNISPLICYESVYGEMILSEKNLITIITNDGWWKNTAGYKQHLVYASLRAIEQRKFVVRSANTGISAVVNSRGDIVKQSEWDEAVCLSSTVQLNNSITYYNRFGDYIGRLSAFVAIILLALSYVKRKLNI